MSQIIRSRDEQVKAFSKAILHEQYAWHTWLNRISSEFSEAEARGAAEQRRKDAEGQEPVRWERMDSKGNWHSVDHADLVAELEAIGVTCRALYERPANVAALEARVKELEGENARLKTAQFYGHDGEEGGSEDISTFFDDHEPGTILEIDGYRRVNTKWVLWDGHFPHVFDTEDEARAALTREGGV